MLLSKMQMATVVFLVFGLVAAGITGISSGTNATAQVAPRQEAQAEPKRNPQEDAELEKARIELEEARNNLRRLNEVVETARKQFLAARDRYEAARKRGRPEELRTITGILRKLDADKRGVYVEMWTERSDPDATLLGNPFTGFKGLVFESFEVPRGARIVQDNLEAKLADLQLGGHIHLKIGDHGVVAVTVDGGTVKVRYQSANRNRNTITVQADKKERQVFHLLKETEVLTVQGQPANLKDLKQGTRLLLTRSVEDPNTVIRIQPAPGEGEDKKETIGAPVGKPEVEETELKDLLPDWPADAPLQLQPRSGKTNVKRAAAIERARQYLGIDKDKELRLAPAFLTDGDFPFLKPQKQAIWLIEVKDWQLPDGDPKPDKPTVLPRLYVAIDADSGRLIEAFTPPAKSWWRQPEQIIGKAHENYLRSTGRTFEQAYSCGAKVTLADVLKGLGGADGAGQIVVRYVNYTGSDVKSRPALVVFREGLHMKSTGPAPNSENIGRAMIILDAQTGAPLHNGYGNPINPPADKDVQGKSNPAEMETGSVKAVEDGMVLISLGRTQGIKVGDQVDVYRLKPKAVYLGRIRIIQVAVNEAVGTVQTRTSAKIEVNDLLQVRPREP